MCALPAYVHACVRACARRASLAPYCRLVGTHLVIQDGPVREEEEEAEEAEVETKITWPLRSSPVLQLNTP